MAEHNDLGAWGEDRAASYLEERGYVIAERDWTVGKRDLDIIALSDDRKFLVFVEVKTRRDDELAEPEQAVDVAKMRNLAIAANAYIKMNEVDLPVRFDIISIVSKGRDDRRIEHIVDAFNPMLVI